MTYLDAYGSDVPRHSPGHVYLGSLRRNRVCWAVVNDGNGSKLKVVDQSPGGTTVDRKASGRTFETGDGKRVTIKSSRQRIQLAQDTVVAVDRGPGRMTRSDPYAARERVLAGEGGS